MPGTLTLRPLSAKLTRNTELFGTMDPYCKIVMGKQKVQSEVCTNGGKNPHWESSFLVLKRNNEQVCEVEIKEKDWLLPDATIGVCKVNLAEVEKQKRILKWYPVTFKEHSVGQILIETSYEPENATSKNAPVSIPQEQVPKIEPIYNQQPISQAPVQKIEPIYDQQPIPQVAPIQHDFRQPNPHNIGNYQGGHIYGYNPLNQVPQNIPQSGFDANVHPSGGYDHPTHSHEAYDKMYAPPIASIQQDSNYPQKYPQLEPIHNQNSYENQYQYNGGAYNNENQAYAYESRPVTDYPMSDEQKQRKVGSGPLDVIRGSR